MIHNISERLIYDKNRIKGLCKVLKICCLIIFLPTLLISSLVQIKIKKIYYLINEINL